MTLDKETTYEGETSDEEVDDDEVFPQCSVRHDTVRTIYEKFKDTSLILNPWYQRGYVWSNAKQVDFITTLWYKQSYIPSVIVLDKAGGKMVVIDGKQRLMSIIAFLENKFQDKNGKFFNKPGYPSYSKDDQKDFESLSIPHAYYKNLTEWQELSIFEDLQKGAPLKQGERYKASMNPLNKSIIVLNTQYPIFRDACTEKREQELANAVRMCMAILFDGTFVFQQKLTQSRLDYLCGQSEDIQKRVAAAKDPKKIKIDIPSIDQMVDTLKKVFMRLYEIRAKFAAQHKAQLHSIEIMVFGYVLSISDISNESMIEKLNIVHRVYNENTTTKKIKRTINNVNVDILRDSWYMHLALPQLKKQKHKKKKSKK
jgi:hypothetical protein